MYLLDGQALIDVQADPVGRRWTFTFDLGGVLETRALPTPADQSRDEQWFLFDPSGRVLSVQNDGRYCYGTGDMPLEEDRWLPLGEPPHL